MSPDKQTRQNCTRLMMDYTEVNAKDTSRAWHRLVADRDGPKIPMTGVRSIIYQSWLRSSSTGISPEQFAAPTMDATPTTRRSKHDNSDLRRATQESLAHIGSMLSGAEAILLLTDRDGIILDTVGDTSTLDKANRINLRVGGIWSEQAAGTNGIGTALWAGQPVFVHGEEHFCEGMKAWSCACSPIRDPIDRTIIGAINLSGLTAIFQKHNAAFAATAAREIEIALEREQSLLHMRLLESIIGTVPLQADANEGLAVVDRLGRLIFNRNCASLPLLSAPGAKVQNGKRLLNLDSDLSEQSILSALPPDHCCQDIRLISLDGVVKCAALVFKPTGPKSRSGEARLAPLPGTVIRGSDLTIIGKSEAILEALDCANRMAGTQLPILIEGQTGVGKGLFARLIHANLSPQSQGPFTLVNCSAAVQATLTAALQSTLGAVNPGSSLFLDEIDALSAETQAFLLRALDERTEAQTVISLTHRVLLDEVTAGRFRRDLFYRLSTITLKIPSLAARGEDILLIAEHFNRKIAAESGRGLLILESEVQTALLAHSWPGNVLELQNVISGLHFLAKGRRVSVADLPRNVVSPSRAAPEAAPARGVEANPESLKDAEDMMIRATLAAQRGNLSRTAVVLGISRPTLYRKMQTYNISTSKSG